MSVRQHIVAQVAASLNWLAIDQDGEPSDPGTTTVAVTRADGSTIHAAGTATTATGNTRTVQITAGQNAAPDLLTATWTGVDAAGTTQIAVSGGVYFTADDLRDRHKSVAVTADYPTAEILDARRQVEAKFERPGMPAFVPRFTVATPSNGFIPQRGVRQVRWVIRDDEDDTLVSTGLDDYVTVTDGGIRCASSVASAGVEFGYDCPPADVFEAALLYARHLLTTNRSRVDFRPVATINPDGSRDQFATPGVASWVTGIPDVDEVLKAYARRATVGSIHARPWWAA